MERAEEAYTPETRMLMSPRCLNCVERVNLPLWLPREVCDYMNLLTCEAEENLEYQVILLRGVKARMEEMTGPPTRPRD
ncbi:hypothetical protein E2P65_03585 [Candidatus Bathyarchaeota archaeon]|nr:hypothetical protein E2P65_03585 [Candidatus Bathyarchaeota archaeon]